MTQDAAGSARLARLFSDESAFFARFQPIVELSTGNVVAYEASLHARSGSRELSPADLFPGARDADSVARLDRLGREIAIRDAAGWLGSQILLVRMVAEMVTKPQLALSGLDVVAAAAALPMRQVVVEVQLTEEREAFAHLARVVTSCRGAGCRVAVADVADAVVMRNKVSMIAPDFIKLGRALVDAPAREACAVIDAAHAAQASVIAFGLETEEQVVAARDCGADWGQGWVFGRPALAPSAGEAD